MPVVTSKYRGKKSFFLVYCRLMTAARFRGSATYQEIAKIMRLPIQGSFMGTEIGQMLGEISEDEHNQGRPMLSAVAVNVRGEPGPGFFGLAESLGKLSTNEPTKRKEFWLSERQAVYAEWAEDLQSYSP